MPDFKIVVSDPEAPKQEVVLKVKVIGDPDVEYTDRIKEKFELPRIKLNPETIKKLGAKHGVVTIRMRRPDTGDKVKITGVAIPDPAVPEGEARVNSEQMINLTGVNELEGEIFRARAWQIRINDERTNSLIGLRIGEEIGGEIVGLKGVRLVITGGSDNSGFPMRPDIHGPVKKRVLLSGPPGFHPTERGERRKKTVRGNTISGDIVQINTMIKY
ncbi:30S ribosomal protein S6e [Thermogladius sp.]|uniref:30S ribosomal protein S6e n=1 Tax=Thermogladius sp. TaxID=2023064 RepID=UPI003D09E05F